MSLPGNGIFVVQGEMAMLVTAMRRGNRWGSHSFPNEEYDVLMRTFQDLKTILNQVDDLRLLDPATYLSPFLEVIRSKETTGPVTSLALSAIHKFLTYGLIDPTHPSVPATVEDIADAVTHARFVGTDHSSDGVVLMKILQVLRSLMLSPEGVMLTDESVCEIMLSCFRICFETRLTELLRRNAEQCLREMTQLVFMRLPQFPPDDNLAQMGAMGLSLKKREKGKKKFTAGTNSLDRRSPTGQRSPVTVESETEHDAKVDSLRHGQDKNLLNEAEITIEPGEPLEPHKTPKKHHRHSSMDLAGNASMTELLEKCVGNADKKDEEPIPAPLDVSQPETDVEPEPNKPEGPELKQEVPETKQEVPEIKQEVSEIKPEVPEADNKLEEYVNDRGIRFTQVEEVVNLQPYGLNCVRELFRFLISLCNPLDPQNTSAMVHLGLCLVGTALEIGADQIAKYPSLLYLVKDPLCRNLLSLLSTERISIFALDLQVSFLLFEALRFHLKYQMEAFFKKLIEIISMDTSKSIYELKEIQHLCLESLAQMFRIPGLCTELFLNYDCDVYCTNIFEEIIKLLSKNVVSSTAYNIHSLSLEAIMTIIEAIESNLQSNQKAETETDVQVTEEEKEIKYDRSGHICLELGGLDDVSVVSDHVTHDISQYVGGGRTGRHKFTSELPSEAELDNIRNMKKWVTLGTELFNQKPEKGIEYLQEHGVLSTPLEPHEVAQFLRENPDLDKKMIGEYICKRSSRGEDDGPSVLGAFAESFDYRGLRIDQALRLYLETFRLPGEAPLIFLVMERFAERWHSTNGEPFANTDAAFRLAYAVIMLNMDQHNHNAKKLNVPMTVEDFVKNLRGCNGSGDFDQAMLEAVFHSIKNEEMVMPAERVGPVRDAYLWRVLQRRGATPGGRYRVSPAGGAHTHTLFAVACPGTVTALSAAFERAPAPSLEEIETNNTRDSAALVAVCGLERVASLVAKIPPPALTLDTLILTLCKFTGLLSVQQANYIAIGVTLGQSPKAQLALRRACAVAARHGHCVRDAWRHLVEICRTLYVGRLLPKSLVEVEDYLSPNGTVSLIKDTVRGSEAGLLSSIYSYIATGETGIRAPTPNEKALIDLSTECVSKCNLPGLLITETKFLQMESLQELVRAMVSAGTSPDADSLQLNPQLEDITIFFLELLSQTLVQNRDRLSPLWELSSPHIQQVVLWSSLTSPCALTRTLTCLLRTCALDRLSPLWELSSPHIQQVVLWSSLTSPCALTRTLTCLLRTCARLMRCASCAPLALNMLRVLFQLPYKVFVQQSIVISCGLYELVKTSAQNVHSTGEWNIVFALLCAAGAGAWPRDAPVNVASSKSASSRSEGSEDEMERRPTSASSDSELSQSPHAQGWIMVKTESTTSTTSLFDMESVTLRPHRSEALSKCCEALALVIRDVAHVTPYNCRAAVRAVRLFGSATMHCAKKPHKSREGRKSRPQSTRRRDGSSDEEVDKLDQYHMVSVQLLDLMHTLHSRTAQIFKWWRDEAEGQGSEDYDLWEVAWKPLLQGIAQFCTDRRKQVANSAIAYLQRALLVPGLSAMSGNGWEACFQSVLFPLLEQLPRRADVAARANTIMCKVFLQHLSALSPRPTFGALWVRVVEVQRSLIAAPDDPLTEAALESLKNMILVMDSVRIFSNGEGYNDLWYITWEKIGEFLPNLKDELFPNVQDNTRPQSEVPSHMQPSIPATLPTLIPVGPNSTPSLLPVNPGFVQGQSLPPNSTQFGQNVPQINQNSLLVNVSMSQASQLDQNVPKLCQNIPQLVPIPQKFQSQVQPPLSVGPSITPTPVSGMVPIRNPLYDQAGLTSSVLLQPLNEMISTPIGISIQSQMPILCPRTFDQVQNDHNLPKNEPILPRHDPILIRNDPKIDQIDHSLHKNDLILPRYDPILTRNDPKIDQDVTDNAKINSNENFNLQYGIPNNGTTNLIPPVSSHIEPTIQKVEVTLQSEPIQGSIPENDHMIPNLSIPCIETKTYIQNQTELESKTQSQNIILNLEDISKEIEQGELYADYLTNPYNDKELSLKEATLYTPETQDQIELIPKNPDQKSLSENTTPMHRNKAQFASSENLKQESSIFNFSSYFGSTERPGAEVFDTLMSTQDG